jgi:sulfatase-like protein
MLRRLPAYPILFALFPALSLAAHNIQEIAVDVIYRPLLISLLMGLAVFILMQTILQDWSRAGLVTLIFLVCFFTYGQLYDKLKSLSSFSLSLFRHRTLLPAYGSLAVYLTWLVVKRLKQPVSWTYWLNIFSIYLLIYPLFVIASYLFQQWSAEGAVEAASAGSFSNEQSPDVYYIILDAYGRQDVLSDRLNYDNSQFLDALRQRGFYVADCSQSNYAYTEYSLPSSLNYDYLEDLNAVMHKDRVALLKQGAVRSFFESIGYQIVAFPTGWNITEWTDADMYIDYEHPVTALTEFETLFAKTTLIRVPVDFRLVDQNTASRKDLRRLRALSLLANIKKLPAVDGNLFVFAHLVVPHPPYSFDADGDPSQFKGEGATDQEISLAYVDQVRFVNNEILEVIDALLSESEIPPVIIVQGDHGPPPELSLTYAEKMPILNAYYLPGKPMDSLLYPSISPVNTFRVVLNSYFGENLPLLKDKSYYAPNANHEAYSLAPNLCPGKP